MYLTKVHRKVLGTEVYERLRDAIFNGELAQGTRLDVRELAQAFGVSGQPIKEAINRLSLEGLVVIKPRSGSYVRTISATDVEQILTARLMFETFAVRNLIPGPSLDLTDLEQAVIHLEALAEERPFPFMAYNEADIRFHEGLIALANNAVLLRLYRSLHAHYVTARGYYQKAYDKAIANEHDHRRVFEALRDGHLEAAEHIVTQHILAAKRGLLQSEEDGR